MKTSLKLSYGYIVKQDDTVALSTAASILESMTGHIRLTRFGVCYVVCHYAGWACSVGYISKEY